jgi:hypothetical protein
MYESNRFATFPAHPESKPEGLPYILTLTFASTSPDVGQGFSLASPSESKPEGLPYILTLTFASTSPDAVLVCPHRSKYT